MKFNKEPIESSVANRGGNLGEIHKQGAGIVDICCKFYSRAGGIGLRLNQHTLFFCTYQFFFICNSLTVTWMKHLSVVPLQPWGKQWFQ